MKRGFGSVLVAVLLLSGVVRAHEVRPAYLQLRQTGPETWDVLWNGVFYLPLDEEHIVSRVIC